MLLSSPPGTSIGRSSPGSWDRCCHGAPRDRTPPRRPDEHDGATPLDTADSLGRPHLWGARRHSHGDRPGRPRPLRHRPGLGMAPSARPRSRLVLAGGLAATALARRRSRAARHARRPLGLLLPATDRCVGARRGLLDAGGPASARIAVTCTGRVTGSWTEIPQESVVRDGHRHVSANHTVQPQGGPPSSAATSSRRLPMPNLSNTAPRCS